MSDAERGRSFLTEDDREYLRGEKALSEGSEYNRKRMIRERVENALLDFTILFNHWDDDERAKVFETQSGTWRGFEDEPFRAGVRDALALILYSSEVTSPSIMGPADRPLRHPVDELIEEAIVKAGRRDDFLVESVEPLEVEATRLRNVLRDLERGEKVNPIALGKVVESEKLNEETIGEIQELVQEDIIGGGEPEISDGS